MTKNIWAVGRNYADHAKELGNALPKEPLFFLKSGSCIQTGPSLRLLPGLGEVHHELELALLIDAHGLFSHYALALDLTDRSAQGRAKAEGLPWTRAKSFKGACVLGEWSPFADSPEFLKQELELKVNGEIRQKSPLDVMIFKPADLLKSLKRIFPVGTGDVLLTGTPQGVGPLNAGDFLEARLGTALRASWRVETGEL
jgi:2-keto-4-pentenoate hydratase/2-oxohepta-3-ene-1,7-dioic acid hydratase in catechol pathway